MWQGGESEVKSIRHVRVTAIIGRMTCVKATDAKMIIQLPLLWHGLK